MPNENINTRPQSSTAIDGSPLLKHLRK